MNSAISGLNIVDNSCRSSPFYGKNVPLEMRQRLCDINLSKVIQKHKINISTVSVMSNMVSYYSEQSRFAGWNVYWL
jgi:hypothetical protein